MGKHTVTNVLHIASKYCVDMSELHDIVIKILIQHINIITSSNLEKNKRIKLKYMIFL